MPTDHNDSDRDRDRDDRSSARSKAAAAASKTKDLSHVPCKFFKVGGCTAGSSCPFSHSSSAEPGQKETCTWFVKGNCKFGHKCALAHVLPGQSPAMDRKNKKAAQAAAAAGNGGGEKAKAAGSGGGRSKREAPSGSPASARLPLLAGGSTAPTRISSSGGAGSRPPMGVPLKASISPSAPAPPLKDTDFAAFATLEEMEGLHQASNNQPSEDRNTESSATAETSSAALPPSAPRSSATSSAPMDFGPIGSPPNYRLSQPTSPTRASNTNPNGAFSPGTSPRNHTHINGVNINTNHSSTSPAPQGTPSAGLLSSSPFSAPGTQSVFLSGSYGAGGGYGNMGMAASLGSGLAMMGGGRKGWGEQNDAAGSPARGQPNSFSGLLSTQLASSLSGTGAQRSTNGYSTGEYDINIEYDDFGGSGLRRTARTAREREVAVEDEEMEDFIPSSLTELLTPEERSRRMSRSHSGQPHTGGISQLSRELAGGADAGSAAPTNGGGGGGGGGAMGHRYSRSVPAPTLLGDIKSIWADTASALPASPGAAGYAGARFDPYGAAAVGAFADADGLSMSMGSAGAGSSFGVMGGLSPSNASAAFLPGLHHHYLSAKAKQQQQQQAQLGLGMGGIGRQLRGASGPLMQAQAGAQVAGGGALAGNYMGALGLPASASSSGFHTHTHGGMQTTYRTTPSPFDLTQTMHHQQQQQQQQQTPYSQQQQQQAQQTQQQQQLGGGGGGGGYGAQGGYAGEDTQHLLSPSARALQAHAPGQSLPQGLAAGYSRIHALPPVTHLALSPPAGGEDGYGGGEWGAQGQQGQGQGTPGSVGGLDSMFSRLSYSAAARGGTPTNAGGNASAGAGTPPPPGLSRNVSAGRYGAGLLSPLSGPVMTKDDDDLFDMESG